MPLCAAACPDKGGVVKEQGTPRFFLLLSFGKVIMLAFLPHRIIDTKVAHSYVKSYSLLCQCGKR